MAVSEALLRYGNAHWDNLTFQSRMSFLDAYMGEMNYPLMIYEGAIKMPESIQEVSRLQGWSNEETIYTLMDFSKRMGWITKDAFDMMMMASESDAYTYAYNEGHSDSRKNEGYQPTMENQKEETRFRKILRQRAETFAGEESWQSGVREYFGDEEMMDFYDWMQDTYNDDDDFDVHDDPEEWRGRVHRYFGDEEMMDFYDWLKDSDWNDEEEFEAEKRDGRDMTLDEIEETYGEGRLCDLCFEGTFERGTHDDGSTYYRCWKCKQFEAETFGAMLMPKRYLMICPECDESVPEMDSCISCLADLSVKETPMVEVVDLEAEEGNLFSEVLIGGLCVFAVSFLLGREAHRRIKG